MAEARWLVSMAASDEQMVKDWANRCQGLGLPGGIAGAIRRAVVLVAELTDDQVLENDPIGEVSA
jgi:hypothetical protein